MYFLVQHYSSIPSTIPYALSLVDEATAHTPTLPELYMAKVRALKRAGDPLDASVTIGAAWRLDLQDRFLNTKYAKYLLRADFIEESNKPLRKVLQVPGPTWKTCNHFSTWLKKRMPKIVLDG
jgi:N-alpha-acetyltransferase 15/16, NatA auxiliary subunit